MDSQLLLVVLVSLISIVVGTIIIRRTGVLSHSQDATPPTNVGSATDYSEHSRLTASLASALPNSVILPYHASQFQVATQAHWAQQACEVVPACILQPRNAEELGQAVKILKDEFDTMEITSARDATKGLFAIRGGGHSPMPGASSTAGGVLIDLRYLNEVTPSGDESSVVIGARAKWMDVSKVLDAKGLAAVGGRNSAVGVGGLTLGGNLLF